MPISDPEKASEYQRLWRVSHPGYYRDRYRKKKAAGLLSRAKQLESERKYTQRIHRDPVLRMITAARKRARALNIEFNILAHQIEMPVFCPYLGYLLNVSADG
ncbi:MAG: hypothetical protein KGI27_13355, partial [Thaumarchaeota archaeon]|nr:hypothetical protein [Nitrososphaerota archaeon]